MYLVLCCYCYGWAISLKDTFPYKLAMHRIDAIFWEPPRKIIKMIQNNIVDHKKYFGIGFGIDGGCVSFVFMAISSYLLCRCEYLINFNTFDSIKTMYFPQIIDYFI